MNTSVKPLIPDVSVSPRPLPRWSDARRTLSNALIITRREVRDSFRDWRIIGPIVILTFLFPLLAQFTASRFTGFVEGYGAQILADRLIPFLLMIVGFFPISISLIIALETFVGEKERRTLEPLLSTPLTNTELYIGKMLSAMIPPLVAAYGGMTVYLLSLLTGELQWRPPAALIVQIVLITTVQALVMVAGAVVVSSQTTSTRAANLLASFIIIPMALVIQGESAIMFLAPDADSPTGIGALWAIIVAMVIVTVLLLRVGNSIFNREELLGRTIDKINLRLVAARIGRTVRAVDAQGTPAGNLIEWYRKGVGGSLRRLSPAMRVSIGVFVVALAAGFVIGLLPQWRLPLPADQSLSAAVGGMDENLRLVFGEQAALSIFVQNGRILLAALLLSIFTFGVAALLLNPLTYFVLGYIISQLIVSGYNPLLLAPAVLTHGIVEIPVIVLATAVAVRLGAVITRPPKGVTVGGAWTTALGDTIKITLGLIIPGLIVAALLEAYITPIVVRALLGG